MAHEERLAKLRDFYSVYRCHTIFNCTKTCPKVSLIHYSLSFSLLRYKGFWFFQKRQDIQILILFFTHWYYCVSNRV